jgi:hypothetical protein
VQFQQIAISSFVVALALEFEVNLCTPGGMRCDVSAHAGDVLVERLACAACFEFSKLIVFMGSMS